MFWIEKKPDFWIEKKPELKIDFFFGEFSDVKKCKKKI